MKDNFFKENEPYFAQTGNQDPPVTTSDPDPDAEPDGGGVIIKPGTEHERNPKKQKPFEKS
jgi:hypothetical protein